MPTVVRRAGRVRVAAGLLALALAPACASTGLPEAPRPAATLAGRRLQDLDWLVAALRRRHPDPFANQGREAFERELEHARSRAAETDGPEHFLDLMRVVATVGDSHTRFRSFAPIEDLQLPVVLGFWQDRCWIAAVQSDASELFAHEVLAVEGRDVAELVRALAPFVPHENEIVLRRGVAKLASLSRALHAAGVADHLGATRWRLRDLSGVEREVALAPRTADQIGDWLALAPEGWSEPLYRSRPGVDWWWTALDERRTLYLKYAACRDGDTPSFAELTDGLAAELDARLDRGQTPRLVIDLRLNGGGDSRVLRPVLDALGARREVDVVALIGPDTFSSGMLNAWQLRRRLGVELVGEPTAQRPNCFGEIRGFELPNSGLALDCSTKRFHLDPADPPSLVPDRVVLTTFEDVYHGRDPVLAAVLAEE